MKTITYEFSTKGLEEALQNNEFKAFDDFIEDLKKTPKVVPIVLVGAIAAVSIYTFGGSVVAYKTMEIGMVAFKSIIVGGGL